MSILPTAFVSSFLDQLVSGVKYFKDGIRVKSVVFEDGSSMFSSGNHSFVDLSVTNFNADSGTFTDISATSGGFGLVECDDIIVSESYKIDSSGSCVVNSVSADTVSCATVNVTTVNSSSCFADEVSCNTYNIGLDYSISSGGEANLSSVSCETLSANGTSNLTTVNCDTLTSIGKTKCDSFECGLGSGTCTIDIYGNAILGSISIYNNSENVSISIDHDEEFDVGVIMTDVLTVHDSLRVVSPNFGANINNIGHEILFTTNDSDGKVSYYGSGTSQTRTEHELNMFENGSEIPAGLYMLDFCLFIGYVTTSNTCYVEPFLKLPDGSDFYKSFKPTDLTCTFANQRYNNLDVLVNTNGGFYSRRMELFYKTEEPLDFNAGFRLSVILNSGQYVRVWNSLCSFRMIRIA